jgi:hypothetical protein
MTGREMDSSSSTISRSHPGPNCGTSNSKVTAQRIYIFNEQVVASFLPMRAGSHMFLASQE